MRGAGQGRKVRPCGEQQMLVGWQARVPSCISLLWRARSASSCSKQLEGEGEVSKLEALQWVHALLARDADLLRDQRRLLLLALCDALGAASGAPHQCWAPGCAALWPPHARPL